jgi:uncharacterized protein YjbI with pentapeptide repeats
VDINLALWDLGNATVALQCGGGYNAYASVRFGDYGGQVQFQAPGSGDWITAVGGDETLQIVPTGDGYFALYSPTYSSYVTINPAQNKIAQNCYPLTTIPVAKISGAARFTAVGLNRAAVFDFLQVCSNASGLSFAGVNLANMNLSGCNLSWCDLTGVISLDGCVLNSANMQNANLSSLDLTNFSISGTDLTEANLSGCDFTSIAEWSTTPTLNQTNLSNAILPGSFANAQLAGANFTGANLTGCNLTNANLSNANFTGAKLDNCDFSGANLSGAIFRNQDFRTVTLTNANLSGADLTNSDMANVSLAGTNLAGTNLSSIALR